LRAVLDHGPVARSTIARIVGLSPAAVTRLTGDLVAAGLLRECAQPAGPKGVGRPHVPVDIDVTRRVALGLHVALSHTTLALLDLRGRVIAKERLPHAVGDSRTAPDRQAVLDSRGGLRPKKVLDSREVLDPRVVLGEAAARIPGFLAEHAAGASPAGLGVAMGGWVDPADGVVVEHALLGWRDVPVRELLAQATGLPVRVDNHSRALARAEQLFGDPRARASVVHLFAGNMVDAAFATGGQVHHGPQSAAGSVAHLPLEGRDEPCLCGRSGCLQAAVSSRQLGLRAAREGIIAEPAFDSLLAAAVSGDQRARRLFAERARLLGSAAALLLDVLNPELLVVTEQGIRNVPGCLEVLWEEASRRSGVRADARCSIVPSPFGDDVLPVAAGTVLLGAVYDSPLRRRLVVSRAS
jgi:predicted NBD/HSP70 family sugar kinase